MKTFKTASVGLLVLAAMTLATVPAQEAVAQTGVTPNASIVSRHNLADRILRRCAHRIKRLAVAGAESNAAITQRCTNAIRFLLNNGNERLARRVARFCIQLVRNRTDRCVGAIKKLCDRCERAMRAAGATHQQLARLHDICGAAVDYVVASRDRCIDDIRSLF